MPRNDLIELRHGTAAAWATANPVLAAGEPGAETDTGKVKVGDGTTAYAALPYVGAGGGNDDGLSRGTLYLTASGTGIEISTEGWGGDGSAHPYSLDESRESSGTWWSEEAGGFSINERGNYLLSVAMEGTAHFVIVPDVIGIDVVDSNTPISADGGINVGFYSDGSDNTPPFTPQAVTPLDLVIKDQPENFIPNTTQRFDLPLLLVGFVGDNTSTPPESLAGATLDIKVRVAITKIAAADPAYGPGDFS